MKVWLKQNMAGTCLSWLEPQIILIDKPSGVTSHDVVAFWRGQLRPLHDGRLLVGHCGTLDPIATGLLIVVVAGAVKAQSVFLHHAKQYEAAIQLGTLTDTGDVQGVVTASAAVPKLTLKQIKTAANTLLGTHVHPVPMYAAAKVKGKKLYEYARLNQEPPWRPIRYSTITLFQIDHYDVNSHTITCTIACSAGTYIRSVAVMLAERLGCVGHLTALRRTAIGQWRVEDALPLSPDIRLRSPLA